MSRLFNKIGLRLTTLALLLAVTHLAHSQGKELLYLEKTDFLPYMRMNIASDNLQTDDNIDVTFYHIKLEPFYQTKSIAGEVRVRFNPQRNNLTEIKLNLRSNFTVSSVKIGATITNHSHTNNILTIPLNGNYNKGDTTEVTISYSGIPQKPAGTEKGFRFDSYTYNGHEIPAISALSTPYLAHYWYPCKDGPSDKADSIKVDITVPNQYNGYQLMAVSNGLLLETETIEDNRRIFKWAHNYPIVPYYVMVAVSNYQEISQTYTNIENGHSFPLKYYTAPFLVSDVTTAVSIMPGALDAFIHYFGDYPFKDEMYGMTQIGYPGAAIETQTNAIMGGLTSEWRETMVHELSHMWFANSITNETWQHIWLNEGFATYAEALYYRYTGNSSHNDEAAYLAHLKSKSSRFESTRTLYREDDSDFTSLFQYFYYHKGAWLLHMLRGYINNDPLFFDILKSYAQDAQFKYGHSDSETFRDYIEGKTDMDFETFFDQWLYDISYPNYQYNFLQAEGLTGVTLRQTQGSNPSKPDVFEMFMEIKFNFNDGTNRIERVFNNKQTQTFYFEFEAGKTVSSVNLDPNEWILREDITRNTNLTVDPPPFRRWKGTVSDDWNHSANWDFGVPNAQTDAIIRAGAPRYPKINGNVSVKSLTIEPGALIEHLGGTFTIGGQFHLKSTHDYNSSFISTGGSLVVAPDSVKIYQPISNPAYNYAMSSPVSGPLATKTNSGITGNTYTYDNPLNTFKLMSDDEQFEPGKGFVFKNSAPVVFSGDINRGTYTLTLIRSAKGKGWNLVGNPYTAAIDWTLLTNKVNVDDSFWLFRNDLGLYGVYNNPSGTSVNLPADPHIIPTRHAIWVRVNIEKTAGSITFSPSALRPHTHTYLKSSGAAKYPYIKLAVDFNNNNRDELAIALIPEDKYDEASYKGSSKYFSYNSLYCEVYSLSNGESLAINNLPLLQTISVPLGISNLSKGEAVFSISDAQLPDYTTVVLLDNHNYELTELSSGDNYSVLLENTGKQNGRFELIISQSSSTATDDIKLDKTNNNKMPLLVYTEQDKIIVLISGLNKAHYSLYDLSGRMLDEGELLNNGRNTISAPGKGVFLLKLGRETGSSTYKVSF